MSGLGRLFGGRRQREDREAREEAERAAAAGEIVRAETEAEAEAKAQADAERLRALPLWTDTHCHLQTASDAAAMLVRSQQAGVRRIVVVGTDAETSRSAVASCGSLQVPSPPHVEMWATVGLHPHEASRGLGEVREFLGEVGAGGFARARIVGIGECGLDYHYDHSPRGAQRTVFAAQVALAHEHGLALVIHTREAWDDTFGVLAAEGVPERTVFHCFSGGSDEAMACLEIGAYLSFSGILTFNSAAELREAARVTPPERLLVETDSPFLTPVPHRGKPNEPSFVPLVGAALAEVKAMERAEVAAVTTANAAVLFGLHG